MTIIQQKKLFTLVKDYETLKNMGMIMSIDSRSRGIYGVDYFIKVSKDILKHITMHALSDIILNKFMGVYGGSIDTKPCTDYIYITVMSYND